MEFENRMSQISHSSSYDCTGPLFWEKEDRLHILTAKRMRDFVQKCDMKVHGGNSCTAVVIYFSQGQKKRYTSKAAGHEKGPSFLLRCEEVL